MFIYLRQPCRAFSAVCLFALSDKMAKDILTKHGRLGSLLLSYPDNSIHFESRGHRIKKLGVDNNNNNIIITKTMFMVLSSWQSHCESSPGSFDECRMAPIRRRPKTKPDDLGCESACTGCQKLHPPSPFIIITQPES